MLVPVLDKLNVQHYIDVNKLSYLSSSNNEVCDNDGNMMYYTIAIVDGVRVNIYLTLKDTISTLDYMVGKLNGEVPSVN